MQRKFKITVDDRDYDVTVVEVTDDGGSLYPDRGTMHAAPLRPAEAQSAASPPPPSPGTAAGPGDVVSPLAGVVLAVEVAVGHTVGADTHVVTLEAMKTKTVVTAGRAGKVTAVLVKPDQAVEAGQPLMTIG